MTAMFCCILEEEKYTTSKQNTIISKDLLKVRNHHKVLFLKRKIKLLIISSDNQFLVERKTKSERS